MAPSVSGRLEALERRAAKRSPAAPGTSPEQEMTSSILLKTVDAARRELDGQPPDPANELTPEEEAFDRAGRGAWLEYLERERDRSPPGEAHAPMRDAITAAIDQTRAEMAEETD